MSDTPPKIITIDDDTIVRESIEAYLEDSGFDMLQAENGRRGLELIEMHQPDLVLVDLRMPGMDGLDVLARVTKSWPDLPVIVVSGTGVLQDAVEALRLGAWDYLIKPIEDMELLEHAVAKALDRARLRMENRQYREHLQELVAQRTGDLEKANARLVESLQEKDIMLKEIHHRVKNNLQIISSLLSLQASQLAPNQDSSPFLDCQNRIFSMSLVHEELYQSNNLAEIDFPSYLDKLVSKLKSIYALSKPLTINLDTSPLPLTVNTAIPCGLLINELVTNALRHGFPGDKQGEVTLFIHRQEGKVRLRVQDNGVGLPPGSTYPEGETLGMRIVLSLVRQLAGEFSHTVDNGLVIDVVFPVAS